MVSVTLEDTGKILSYEKLHVLKKNGKCIAECIAFPNQYNKKNIDFSFVKPCCGVSIEECVDVIVEYAKKHKYRLVEYPLICLYKADKSFSKDFLQIEQDDDDIYDYDCFDHEDVDFVEQKKSEKRRRNENPSQSYQISQYLLEKYDTSYRIQVSNNGEGCNIETYATFQILPNIIVYDADTCQVGLSLCKSYTDCRDGNFEIPTTGKAYLYTEHKPIEVWVYKGNNLRKKVDTVNIEFEKSLILIFDRAKRCGCDLYTGFTINNQQVACEDASMFRINKWGFYSDIESYTICFGYSKIQQKEVKVISKLCFPGGNINELCFPGASNENHYIDYTTKVYDALLPYSEINKELLEIKRKAKLYVQKRKKPRNEVAQEAEVHDTDESDEMSLGYIYLLREREFYKRNEEVYKVGRTKQKNASLSIDRLKAYKKGSELVLLRQVSCDNVIKIETDILKQFDSKFIRHDDGREYYIGNAELMVAIINEVCNQSK